MKNHGTKKASSSPKKSVRSTKTSKSSDGNRRQTASLASTTPQSSRPPVQRLTKTGRVVQGKEFIGSVLGSIAFTPVGYALNPGIATTFPWLSTQAVGYELYRFIKLKFHYINRTSATVVGSVILAPDYDAADSPPTTESRVTTYAGAKEGSAWNDIECVLDPAAMNALGTRKFIRTGFVGTDIKTFDSGNFFMCTTEQVGTDVIGKLWVEYEVEFFTPQLASNSQLASASRNSFYTLTGAQTLTTGVAATVVYTTAVSNAIGLTNASGLFTLPNGAWKVSVQMNCSDATAESFSLLGQIQKNGANTDFSSRQGGWLVVAAGTLSLQIQGIVIVNGTDTISVTAFATGAAGVITLNTLRNSIMFTPA